MKSSLQMKKLITDKSQYGQPLAHVVWNLVSVSSFSLVNNPLFNLTIFVLLMPYGYKEICFDVTIWWVCNLNIFS